MHLLLDLNPAPLLVINLTTTRHQRMIVMMMMHSGELVGGTTNGVE